MASSNENNDTTASFETQKKQVGGFIGYLYQSKISMVYLLNGLARDYDFKLKAEVTEANKFDDIIFLYKNKTDEKCHAIIVQAKHKVKTTDKIKKEDLLTAKDVPFGLVKYFNSYQKAKKSDFFKVNIIDYCILYTNCKFTDHGDTSFWSKIDVPENNVLRLCKIGEKGDFYKFDADKILPILKPMILQYSCEYTKIAGRLVKIFLKNDKLLPNEFNEFDYLLAKYVIDINTKKFRDSFIDGDENDSVELRHFRNILASILENEGQKLEDLKNENKTFYISKNFGKLDDKQRWPKIEIQDSDIRDFFDKTVFFVGQSNENELGKTIECEIQEKYFTNNITYKYLVDEFNNWTKGEEFPGSKISITHVDARKFFADLNIKLNGSILRRSFENLNFHFDDPKMQESLEDFLISEEQVMNITTEFTKLTTMKVYQFLEFIKKNNSKLSHTIDNFILFHLKSQIDQDLDMILKSFRNPLCSHSLLIIECSLKMESVENFFGKIEKELIELLEKRSEKKVIFVGINMGTIFKGIIEKFTVGEDIKLFKDLNVNFENLKRDSQERILENQYISFQQSNVKLNEIFNERSKYLINGDLLTNFISDEIPEIGTSYEGSKELEKYYISRSFFFEIKYDNNVLILNGFDEEDLCMLLQSNCENSKINTFELQLDEQNIIIVSESEKIQLRKDLELGMNEEICILEKKDSIIIPMKKTSKFSFEVEKIRKLIKSEFENRCILFPSIAGMGKSSVFDSLYNRMKKRNPTTWIYKIILNDLTESLFTLITKEITENNLLFFLKKALNLKTDVEVKLFNNYLEEKHVVLLFDGIDEISPNYTKTIFEIIKKLITKKGIKRVFISTRPHDSVINNIKDLNSLVCKLQPFEVSNREEFLKKFWLRNNENDDFSEKSCEDFSKLLLLAFANNMKDKKNDFLHIPIHLMMIGTLSQNLLEDFKNIAIHERQEFIDSQEFGEMSNISHLYGRFILQKFHVHYIEKKGSIITKPDNSRSLIKSQNKFVRNSENISLMNILDENHIDLLLDDEELRLLRKFEKNIKDDEKKYGIINKIIDGKVNFVHKTFDDYFVAKFILKEFTKDSENRKERITLLFQAIMKEEHVGICNFLDNMLKEYISNKNQIFENHLIVDKLDKSTLNFVLKNDCGTIAILLIKNNIDLHQIDENQDTIFHLFLQCYNSDQILISLLEKLQNTPEVIKDFFKKRNVCGFCPLFSSLQYKKIECIKIFLKAMKQLNFLDTMCSLKDEFDNNVFHAIECDSIRSRIRAPKLTATENENMFIIKEYHSNDNTKLYKTFFDELNSTQIERLLLEKNRAGFTPLFMSLSPCIFEKLKELKMLSILINIRVVKGYNILHFTFIITEVWLCQIVLNILRTDPNTLKELLQQKDENQVSPCFTLIANNKVSCFKVFLETLKHVELLSTILYAEDIAQGGNIIHVLTFYDCDEITKLLFAELKTDCVALKKLLLQRNKSFLLPLQEAVQRNKINLCSIVFQTLKELNILNILVGMKFKMIMPDSKIVSEVNISTFLTKHKRDEIKQLLFDNLKDDDYTLGKLLFEAPE